MKKVIEKPKHLQNPRRAFVKRNGKKLVRKIASFQSRQSFVPDSPKIDNKYFPFLKSFTDNWLDIKEEALEVMKFKEVIPGFQDISPDQYRLATENNWKTFVLFGFGKRLEKNSSLAPKTSKLLEAVPNLQTAMFSILAPGYHIPAHSGVTKGILRSHIGLIIPSDLRIVVFVLIILLHLGKRVRFLYLTIPMNMKFGMIQIKRRVILLFDFDRPMKFWGRFLNAAFLQVMKFTAFYQDPKKNLKSAEDRLEDAIRKAGANIEAMSDPAS